MGLRAFSGPAYQPTHLLSYYLRTFSSYNPAHQPTHLRFIILGPRVSPVSPIDPQTSLSSVVPFYIQRTNIVFASTSASLPANAPASLLFQDLTLSPNPPYSQHTWFLLFQDLMQASKLICASSTLFFRNLTPSPNQPSSRHTWLSYYFRPYGFSRFAY